MPTTAIQHFQEDIGRARAIVTHADPLPNASADQQLLRSDLLRSGWMFAVGALDAYFCDAYTDIVAASVISKNRHPAMVLPDFFYEIKFPVRAILEPYANNMNWRWRMAARKMMERETVLTLDMIQSLFNKFFRPGYRFFGDLLDGWITHPQAKKRLFGITQTAYSALTSPVQKEAAKRNARIQMYERFRTIFQRRHDCIHNCDRPRVSPQRLMFSGTVLKVIEDIEFLVNRCNDHINGEFRQFLIDTGCSSAVVAQVGY